MQQFETQRLILRAWQPAQDARQALDIYGNREVTRWIAESCPDRSAIEVQRRLQRYLNQSKQEGENTGCWAVQQKDIGRVIGHVMLLNLPDLQEVREQHVPTLVPGGLPTDYIEIGWHFRPASWGFGYATEAAQQIIRYAFNHLKLALLLAVIAPENQRSAAVAERLGMRYDGLTTRYYGGKALSLYRLNQDSWRAVDESP